jgi:hypothetical protein
MPTPFEWVNVTDSHPVINGQPFDKHIPDRPQAFQTDKATGRIFKFEVMPGDICTNIDGSTGGGKERCEISTQFKASFNADYWFSYYLMLETIPSADSGSAGWGVFGQIHQSEDVGDVGASPLYARTIDRATGKIAMDIRNRTTDPLVSSPGANLDALAGVSPYAVNWQYGSWIHVVSQHRFDPTGGTGYHRIWHNNVQVMDTGTINTGYVDAVGPYFKFGIYRAADASHTWRAYYANIEFGTNSGANTTIQGRRAAPLIVG